ncbi:MBL fold metallo-hydrolase [Cellulomonas pakistanensis]|uniref:MBL fold hydrolase n=1 Tax=Cellulomonas pakistanensis TaxID=992287 RepID=A0A919PEI1_9CELL|nr:MBL fold metallo-hydrolase [Cellulomonas pakistanensis]GIG38206.1 MBL fold hydrolase [Cellulomonas pakistanensis]
MRILGLTAPVFAAACYLVAADDGACVVVDPGGGVADAVRRTVAEHGLRVVGVVATHGHADHVADAGVLAAAAGVPLRLHARDAYRLADPLGSLGLGATADPGVAASLRAAAASAGLDPATFGRVDPALVAPFGGEDGPGTGPGALGAGPGAPARTADVELRFGSVTLVARHAPGHTEGSTLYLLDAGEERVAFTGDVLFAGSVGRTDLPGGDPGTMAATLREVVATLPPGTHVLPGHGPATRVDAELATNPYLAG